MPDLWTRRLLRRFAEPARHRPLRADGASGLPVVRAGRAVALVLHRPRLPVGRGL